MKRLGNKKIKTHIFNCINKVNLKICNKKGYQFDNLFVLIKLIHLIYPYLPLKGQHFRLL